MATRKRPTRRELDEIKARVERAVTAKGSTVTVDLRILDAPAAPADRPRDHLHPVTRKP